MGQSESLISSPGAVELPLGPILRLTKNLCEISSMTYSQFLDNLNELNTLSRQCMNPAGKQLLFNVKKGSDSSVLWKGTIKIACLKYDPTTNERMKCCRLLNLLEFVKIFKTIKSELDTAQEIEEYEKSTRTSMSTLVQKLTDAIENNTSDDTSTECDICLDRKQEIMLPCSHSYCQLCITLWNVNNNTCPICREVMSNRDEEWILPSAPNSAEINEHIASSLMEIANDENK